MKTRVGLSFFFVPLLYAGIILGLLYLQFGERSGFTEQFRGITIRGNAAEAGGSRESDLIELHLQASGLSFHFSNSQPLRLRNANGDEVEAALLGYRVVDNGLEVLFDRELTLRLSAEDESNSRYVMAPSLRAKEYPILSLPFSVPDRNARQPEEKASDLLFRYKGESYLISLPSASSFDIGGGRILLSAAGSNPSMVFERAPDPVPQSRPGQWFTAEEASTPESAYRTERDRFLDTAYRGWTDTRVRPNGTWEMGEGAPRFSEEAFVALHVESLRRNSTERILTLNTEGSPKPAATGFLAAPITGDLMQADSRRREEERKLIDRIASLSGAGNPDLFLVGNLVPLLATRGPRSLLGEVLTRTVEMKPTDLSLQQATGLLEAVIDARSLGLPDTDGIPAPLAIAEARLFPAIRRTEIGPFLVGSNGSVDIRTQVLAGNLLQRIRDAEHSDAAQAIGRALIVSALGKAQDTGFLPASLQVAADSITGSSGIVTPESIYPCLADTPYYPHEATFFRETAAGVWIWTAAKVTLETSQERYRFTFEFPAGATHQAIVFGVPKFREANLFDKTWPGTNQFQRYHSGYYYDPSQGTLFLKIRHRGERETMILSF